MKKIFGLLCCLCAVLSSFITVLSAEETTLTFNKYEVVTELGFMKNDSNGEFNPDNKVTRSEFAEIACNIMNVNVTKGELDFKDVSIEDEKYDYIFSICEMKLMVGKSPEEFAPYDFITYDEVTKVMMDMMGYEEEAKYHGGYPSGYNNVASRIGIPSGKGYITKGQLANVIYECMRAPTSEEAYKGITVEIVEGQTLLSKYHNIIFGEGIVNANCNTGINSTTDAGIDLIEINGEYINCTPEQRNLLGYNVEFYVEEKYDTYELVCAVPKKNKVINLKWDEFITEKSSMQKIFYKSESGKDRYIKLSDTVSLIYNGVYLFDCTVDDFIPTYGETVFLDNDSDGIYDIAFADDYKAMRIGRIMPNEEMIFNADGTDSVSLKGLNVDDIVFENNGEMIWLDDIEALYDNLSSDSILLIAESKSGDKTIKLSASNSVSTKKIISKDDEYANSEDNTYRFNPFAVQHLSQLMLGKQYVLYFDSYGLVSECRLSGEGKKYGYLIDAKAYVDETEEEVLKIKVYTIDSDFKTYFSGEKVIVKTGNTSDKLKPSEARDKLYENGKVKNQLIIFDTDKDGKLKSLEIARDSFGDMGDEYFTLNYDNSESYVPYGYYIVGQGNGSLPYEYSGLYSVRNAICMTVPSEAELSNEKLYNVKNVSNLDQGSEAMHIMLYDVDSDGMAPMMVVVGTTISSEVTSPSVSVMVLDRAVEELDENEEIVTVVKGYCMQEYVEYTVTDDDLSKELQALSRGDVLFIWKNDIGEIKDYKLSFSYKNKQMYPVYNYFYESSTTKHGINTHDVKSGDITYVQRYCMYGVISDIRVVAPDRYAVEITMEKLDSATMDNKTSWDIRRTLEIGTSDGSAVIYDNKLKNGNAQDLKIGDNIYFTAFRNYVDDKSACVVYR